MDRCCAGHRSAGARPPLSHDALGRAKRVEQRGEGAIRTAEVETGDLSIVPAGTAYDWSTRGPIEFAHLYLAPASLTRVGAEEFDRDTTTLCLEDRVGIRDPLLRALFLQLLGETTTATTGSRLHLDTLFHALQLCLLRSYANAPSAPLRQRHSIAPFRLRRVLDFIDSNLAADVALVDLASVAGTSPFHFCRAFASEMGAPPYGFMLTRRIERATHLLKTGDEPMRAVARQCGFKSAAQFSRMFKRITGCSPLVFRRGQSA